MCILILQGRKLRLKKGKLLVPRSKPGFQLFATLRMLRELPSFLALFVSSAWESRPQRKIPDFSPRGLGLLLSSLISPWTHQIRPCSPPCFSDLLISLSLDSFRVNTWSFHPRTFLKISKSSVLGMTLAYM